MSSTSLSTVPSTLVRTCPSDGRPALEAWIRVCWSTRLAVCARTDHRLLIVRCSSGLDIRADKMSAQELDNEFRKAVTGEGPDAGWTIKNDERVKYVGKLEVSKGEDQTLKVGIICFAQLLAQRTMHVPALQSTALACWTLLF